MASIFRPPAPGQVKDDGRTADFSTYGAQRGRSLEIPEEAVPHLLVQLQDDLARSRMREAFWISVITHIVLILAILFAPKLLPVHPVQVVAFNPNSSDHELTFLNLPPDLQKPAQRPKTNILSDKDRTAASRNPVLDRRELQKLLNAERAGARGHGPQPAPVRPSAPAQAPEAQVAQAPPQQQGQQAGAPPQQSPNSNALLQPVSPPAPSGDNNAGGRGPFKTGPTSVEEAAAATAPGRGQFGGGGGGDLGMGSLPQSNRIGPVDILADTQGVDFGPYISRLITTVRRNWIGMLPESVKAPFFDSGDVLIEFTITPNGRFQDIAIARGSGKIQMDRAALASITVTDPFEPLPKQWHGDTFRLRFHYYYNPDRTTLR